MRYWLYIEVMNLNSVINKVVLAVVIMSSALTVSVSAEEEKTPLYESMKEANTALKMLRKIDPSDWSAGAAAAREAAAGILKGFAYIPALVSEMPEGKEKTVAIADYRRLMGLSYASICQLELAYLAEDQALVEAAQANVKEVKKEGHKKYED